MSNNPLFPASDEPAKNPAVELIRGKVARAFTAEPDAAQELAEIQTEHILSKHQQFMQSLSSSGKSLAEIQTAWHHYYTTLSDTEKHEVWQEFYDANRHTPYQQLFQRQHAAGQPAADTESERRFVPAPNVANGGMVVANHLPAAPQPAPMRPSRNTAATRQLKRKIVDKINAGGKLTTRHHLQSLGFGLASGTIVLVIFLFTFFNEYVIAPFIQPSRNVSSTPIILGSNTASADTPPSVTIPKINIQIPLNFNVSSYDEVEVDDGLKSGVIHYPNTAMPGQNGNGAYFGHSSGNIFNNGKYKFAFTLLHNLTTGDLFYLTYGGKTYAYRVFAREVVPPSAVSVINDTKGKTATATLITCDPPGVSTNRLVVWGEQISPAVGTNSTAPTASTDQVQPVALTDNGPTLWDNFVNWVEFWR